MDNIKKQGTTVFVGTDTGPRGGVRRWYTARAAGQDRPGDRALWCRTKREALENAGVANVSHTI